MRLGFVDKYSLISTQQSVSRAYIKRKGSDAAASVIETDSTAIEYSLSGPGRDLSVGPVFIVHL